MSMFISENRVRDEFKSDSLFSFDPSVGYVRIPESKVLELVERYGELVSAGEMTEGEKEKLVNGLHEKNKANADADKSIKENMGADHFYGEKGTPLLLTDRMRFGMC